MTNWLEDIARRLKQTTLYICVENPDGGFNVVCSFKVDDLEPKDEPDFEIETGE